MTLHCLPCLDQVIAGGHDAASEEASRVPYADTLVTVMQPFTVNGQPVMAPVSMPVCYSCRVKQLGGVSKRGLVTA